jgi:hypothetical protein
VHSPRLPTRDSLVHYMRGEHGYSLFPSLTSPSGQLYFGGQPFT